MSCLGATQVCLGPSRVPKRIPTCLSRPTDACMRNALCSFRKYTLELYDRLSALLLELKIHMLRAGVLLLETACMRHPETARVLLIL